jgi:Uma2 family endonuclease
MARPPAIETEPGLWLALNIRSLHLTDDQLLRFFRDNDDEYRFEVSAQQELIIMSPSTLKGDHRNAEVTRQLGNWAKQDGAGVFFGSNALFTLPNGAKRSPDGPGFQRAGIDFLKRKRQPDPHCPDFVIELRSKSDRLARSKKMDEYMDSGVRLGWLLDPSGIVLKFIVRVSRQKKSTINRSRRRRYLIYVRFQEILETDNSAASASKGGHKGTKRNQANLCAFVPLWPS